MTGIKVGLVDDDAQMAAVRALCGEWLNWHWKHYPADWPTEGNPMDPARFEGIVADLPTLHARPKGAILLASVDARPVGCVMYNEAAPGVAEFNRMFVNTSGRGYGIGRRLLDEMCDQMRADGYDRVIFSSATFLTHARDMYRSAGFTDMPHPDGFLDEWRAYVYFMEKTL